MKTPFPPQCRNHGLTLIELLVVLFILGLLAAMILPALTGPRAKSSRIGCVNNLKQIGLGFRIFATDNNDRFPAQYFTNWSGVLSEPNALAALYGSMSNELSTPKILHCPQDLERSAATNWTSLQRLNLSYFMGLDAKETQPQTLLAGDRNLSLRGQPIGPGLHTLTTNTPVGWTDSIHRRAGNVVLGDGSVQQMTSPRLADQLSSGDPQRILVP